MSLRRNKKAAEKKIRKKDVLTEGNKALLPSTFSKKARSLFLEGKYDEIVENFRQLEKMVGAPTPIELLEGPLAKNKYTFLLEEITKKLLTVNIKDVSCKIKVLDPTNEYSKTQIYLNIKGKEYDLNDILENANMSHLHLSENMHQNYEQFLKGNSEKKPKLNSYVLTSKHDFLSHIKNFKLTNNIKKILSVEDLTFAEMSAINIYSQKYYKSMIKLMRCKWKDNNIQNLKEVILHSVFCSIGLNKCNDECVPYVFRFDNVGVERKLNQYKESIKNGKDVTFLEGFVSTSFKKPHKKFLKIKDHLELVIDNVIGKRVEALSAYPEEREFTIPPHTQVRWNNYVCSDFSFMGRKHKAHIFYGTAVRALDKLTDKQKELAIDEVITENLLEKIKNIKCVYETLKEQLKFEKKPGLMNHILMLQKRASKLIDDNDISAIEKYKNISKALNKLEVKLQNSPQFLLLIKNSDVNFLLEMMHKTKIEEKRINKYLNKMDNQNRQNKLRK